jgi:toxin ParE1/3/4
MAHKIIWSPDAFHDLDGIYVYIARDSQTIAATVVERILDAIDRLADFPLLGPRIREWKTSPYRHIVIPPHRVIYRFEQDVVFIIAIIHGARDLKRLLRKRGRK